MADERRKTKLKCLALACSPRKGGNTVILAGQALDIHRNEGYDTKLLYLVERGKETSI